MHAIESVTGLFDMRATIPDEFRSIARRAAPILDSRHEQDEPTNTPTAPRCTHAADVGTRGVSSASSQQEEFATSFLSPVSIVAVIVGLVAGGDKPDVYFRRVQRFGRRSDLWINVSACAIADRSADEIVTPVRGVVACANAARRTLRARRRTRQPIARHRQPEEYRPAATNTR